MSGPARKDGSMEERRQKRRWLERAVLGTFMSIAAFIIERRVRRALRRTGGDR